MAKSWSILTEPTFFTGIACGIVLSLAIFYTRPKKRKPKLETDSDTETEDEEFTIGGEETDRYKLVLVVRNDLKMGKGKAAAQCSHAAVLAYEQASKRAKDMLSDWRLSGQAKVVVKVETDEELEEIASQARKAGLITSVIRDAGRTQIAPNSRTVVGVGPGPEDLVNEVTGHLKLY